MSKAYAGRSSEARNAFFVKASRQGFQPRRVSIPAPAPVPAVTQSTHSRTSLDTQATPLGADELRRLHAWWRACNYLAVGMIYLRDNPLLREPLVVDHIKHRLLVHWGASPALSFVWAHLNRVIRRDDLNVIFIAGPGHGAPGVLGPVYLEGTPGSIYPDKSEDAEGLQKFFKQFSFPGHIGSHVTPETPGSIHEGGELGYSLSHAFGARSEEHTSELQSQSN